MWYDDQCEYEISARNFGFFLSQDERSEIETSLNKHGIGITFIETRGIQASIFHFLSVYINENITELLIAGMFMPAMYDATKEAIRWLWLSAKEKMYS